MHAPGAEGYRCLGTFREMECCLLVRELRQTYICLKVCGIGWADTGYTRLAEHAAEGYREIERRLSMPSFSEEAAQFCRCGTKRNNSRAYAVE